MALSIWLKMPIDRIDEAAIGDDDLTLDIVGLSEVD